MWITPGILTINLSHELDPVGAIGEPAEIMAGLQVRGLEQIDLVGLSRFRAKFRDGEIWDAVALRVDEDAMFLIEAYQQLQNLLPEQVTRMHQVYLGDGSFEITAQFSPQGVVKMRMGEYRSEPFSSDSEDAIRLPIEEYASMWNTIGGTIARASVPRASE